MLENSFAVFFNVIAHNPVERALRILTKEVFVNVPRLGKSIFSGEAYLYCEKYFLGAEFFTLFCKELRYIVFIKYILFNVSVTY